MTYSIQIYLAAQLFSLWIGYISYKRKSVSVSGLAALLIISSLFIWLDKIPFLIVVFLMFASSSLLTRFKEKQKEEFKAVVAKTGSRDYIQAICNLGAATVIMLLHHFIQEVFLIAAFIGSVAAANADSWASEIGGLSKRQPVMITNFKPVAKGISGGVTWMGMMGGLLGALFVSSVGTVALLLNENTYPLTLVFISSFIAGILGFILDSYLGAWLQALYVNDQNHLTENPERGKLKKGWEWVDNDVVNLLTTVTGGIMTSIVYLLI